MAWTLADEVRVPPTPRVDSYTFPVLFSASEIVVKAYSHEALSRGWHRAGWLNVMLDLSGPGPTVVINQLLLFEARWMPITHSSYQLQFQPVDWVAEFSLEIWTGTL